MSAFSPRWGEIWAIEVGRWNGMSGAGFLTRFRLNWSDGLPKERGHVVLGLVTWLAELTRYRNFIIDGMLLSCYRRFI